MWGECTEVPPTPTQGPSAAQLSTQLLGSVLAQLALGTRGQAGCLSWVSTQRCPLLSSQPVQLSLHGFGLFFLLASSPQS